MTEHNVLCPGCEEQPIAVFITLWPPDYGPTTGKGLCWRCWDIFSVAYVAELIRHRNARERRGTPIDHAAIIAKLLRRYESDPKEPTREAV